MSLEGASQIAYPKRGESCWEFESSISIVYAAGVFRRGCAVSKKEEKGNGQEELKEAAIKYQYSRDYRILPANGCFGGPTSRGEIMVYFFEEHFPVPSLIIHEVTDAGSLGKEKARHTEGAALVRELQVAIVMSPVQAESIAKWILGKVDEFKKRVSAEDK